MSRGGGCRLGVVSFSLSVSLFFSFVSKCEVEGEIKFTLESEVVVVLRRYVKIPTLGNGTSSVCPSLNVQRRRRKEVVYTSL
jgi:hypothetical protein